MSRTGNNMFGTIETVSAGELLEFLEDCAAAKRVPMIYGPPGVGKSTIVGQWVSRRNRALYDIRLAQLLPEHLAAIQYPDNNRQHVVRLTPAVVADVIKLRKDTGKPVTIFADEITLASAETLSASLELILDGRVNGFALPPDTEIVAAGNRPQDTSSAAVLDPPVRSRVASVVYIPSPEDVAAFLRATHPKLPLAELCARFLLSQQAAPFVRRDEIGDDASFFTPRGLESAILIAAPHAKDASALQGNKRVQRAFSSTVGRAFFAALSSWSLVAATVTDPAAVLDDVDGADIPDSQQGVAAQLDALRDHCHKQDDKKTWQKFVSYMTACKDEYVSVWLNKQNSTTIDAIGSSARGMRFLDQIGHAGGITEADATAAKG